MEWFWEGMGVDSLVPTCFHPVAKMLDLGRNAAPGCASGGTVLFHTAGIVPHHRHVAVKQRAAHTEKIGYRDREEADMQKYTLTGKNS